MAAEGSRPGAPKSRKPLRLESLRLRVERNRIRFVVFVTTFVIGSAVLLTLAFVAVPGSLIGLVWGRPGLLGPVPGSCSPSPSAWRSSAGASPPTRRSPTPSTGCAASSRGASSTRRKHPRLVRAVEEMSIAGGMAEPPALLLLHVDSVNACAIGATRKSPVIGVTAGTARTASRCPSSRR